MLYSAWRNGEKRRSLGLAKKNLHEPNDEDLVLWEVRSASLGNGAGEERANWWSDLANRHYDFIHELRQLFCIARC
jgi:hypothetical protein